MGTLNSSEMYFARKIDDIDFDRSACAIVSSDDLTKELSIEENVEIITRRSKRSLMRCCGVFD